MSPVDLEIQSDSEVESLHSASEESDSDSDSYEQHDFEERQKKSASNEVRDIASGATSMVRRWKAALVFMLLATTAFVTAGTYYFLEQEETDDYHESYSMLISSIQSNVENHFADLEEAMHTLGQLLASPDSSSNWHIVGPSALAQAKATVIVHSPLVETPASIPSYFESTLEEADWYPKSVNAAVQNGQGELSDYDLNDFGTEIYNLDDGGNPYPANGTGPFAPLWLMSPPPLRASTIHYNLLDKDMGQVQELNQTRRPLFSRLLTPGEAPDFVGMVMSEEDQKIYYKGSVENSQDDNVPHSIYWVPVWLDPYDTESRMVGFLTAYFAWDRYVARLSPKEARGIFCVIRNNCGQAATYELDGTGARFLGPGDMHDTRYDDTLSVVPFGNYSAKNDPGAAQCQYSFVFSASETFEEGHRSSQPVVITAIVGSVFAVLILIFWRYDRFVGHRNRKVVSVAAKTNEIVASLFPEAVRNRLFDDKEEKTKSKANVKNSAVSKEPRESMIQKYLSGSAEMDDEMNGSEDFMYKSRPIADMYPETTIMFADIAGFTAWSSTRDPAQVFTLLETFYKAFDEIAKKRGVFKVETIGDCYVAVAGLPEPREDHAVVMCKFASECLERMNFLSQKLEVHLGPDTAELEMRAGLHSGAVTAGVLRGVRSRFQLFGDTMNTASRMESTGQRGKIQVSQETADLLVAAGKNSWITPREERIVAKGKGELQTYWVNIASTIDIGAYQDGYSSIDGSLSYEDGPFATLSPKTTRLVLWNVEILLDLLRQIHVQRGTNETLNYRETVVLSKDSATTGYDEVQDVIRFPSRSNNASEIDTDGVELKAEVEEQLEDFLSTIASMYIDNHFHDFAHASHATMGVVKLLSSLVKPKPDETSQSASSLVALNPLVQFAVVLSVICHDVDHPGVPNSVLINEKSRMASVYGYKSIAEQNSLDLAWDLLMDDSYRDLRAAIYQTDEDKKLFRQILVNCIISTDLFDENLRERFESRWNTAFPEQPVTPKERAKNKHLQATLLIETIVQASDIAHTIQHWQVYRKWNARLFDEMYQAFVDKRQETDPSEDWFQAEIDFFDTWVLPVAKKLRSCGAFVAASTDSHMDYAEHNRIQWVEKGREIVHEMSGAAKSNIFARSQDYPLDLEN